jgi:hypothetical protein
MVFKRLFKFTILFSLLSSCRNSDELASSKKSCTPAPTSANSPIIIGNNDWILYTNTGDDPQNANERTVAQVKIPALIASCTGFLINEDTLMTNNHCIAAALSAVNVKAIFRDSDGSRTTYSCDQFITTSTLYDFTLVKCANSPGLKFGWVGLAKEMPIQYTPIYVVEENCDFISNPHCTIDKFVAFGEVVNSETGRTYHDADTLPGSSGSPIFSKDTHQVISLHNSGVPATSTTPAMNAGVPMYQIRKIIEQFSTPVIPIYEFGTVGKSANGKDNSLPNESSSIAGTTSSSPTAAEEKCVL